MFQIQFWKILEFENEKLLLLSFDFLKKIKIVYSICFLNFKIQIEKKSHKNNGNVFLASLETETEMGNRNTSLETKTFWGMKTVHQETETRTETFLCVCATLRNSIKIHVPVILWSFKNNFFVNFCRVFPINPVYLT